MNIAKHIKDIIIRHDICGRVLGTSVEDFIDKNRIDLESIFPKDNISFDTIKGYYSSDAYSAKLLCEMGDVLSITSLEREFIDTLVRTSAFARLNVLCYGGQYHMIPFLLERGFDVVCMGFPGRMFEIFREAYKHLEIPNTVEFHPMTERLDDYHNPYNVIVAPSVMEHVYNPQGLFGEFSRSLDAGGILYVSFESDDSFEHLYNFNRYDIVGIVEKHGFVFLLGCNKNILVKAKSLRGVGRFNYTNRHIVASIQNEIFTHTINAVCRPEIVVNVGGPPGEFCRKSVSVDIVGEPDIIAEGECLPFKNGSIDLVYSCHSLEHMKNTREALTEWLRVLKKGGILAIIVPVLPYHRHSNKVALGETCFEEHTAKEYRHICECFDDIAELRQFNVRNNDFDIDIILEKK